MGRLILLFIVGLFEGFVVKCSLYEKNLGEACETALFFCKEKANFDLFGIDIGAFWSDLLGCAE